MLARDGINGFVSVVARKKLQVTSGTSNSLVRVIPLKSMHWRLDFDRAPIRRERFYELRSNLPLMVGRV